MSVLKDTRIFLAGYDLSGELNATSFDYGAEMLDDTRFTSGARINKPGLLTARIAHEGYWRADGDGPDDAIFDRLGTANVVTSLVPETGAVGEVAYTFRAVHPEYSLGGPVGALLPFSVTAEGDDGIAPVRGKVLQATGSVTASGTSDGVEIGAASSDQTAYCALHVVSADGTSPTLDVTVESDVDDTFSSPVTVATFSQQTGIGSDWQTNAGANSDTFYRVSYTVGGTSPDFSFAVIVGII